MNAKTLEFWFDVGSPAAWLAWTQVPLLARERDWGATTAGVIEACWIAGTLAIGLLAARVGTRARPRPPLVGGPVLAALGVMALVSVVAQERGPSPVSPQDLRAAIDRLGSVDYPVRTKAAQLVRRSPAAEILQYHRLVSFPRSEWQVLCNCRPGHPEEMCGVDCESDPRARQCLLW